MVTGITIVISIIILIGIFLLGVWYGSRLATNMFCNSIKDTNKISDDIKLIILEEIIKNNKKK